MELRPLEQIRNEANVIAFVPPTRESRRALRRVRLERLASVLEEGGGNVKLFSRVEYLPDHVRRSLRSDESPLTIAFRDPMLRADGLASDRFGEAMQFFGLTQGEAHTLLCDCHYVGKVTPEMIAARARMLAHRLTFREVLSKVCSALKLF